MSENGNGPTLKSWLRDGAELVGLDKQTRQSIKDKSESILKDVSEELKGDLKTLEGGVRTLEEKATAGLSKLRQKLSTPSE